ncbi:hypothetical protein HJC23_000699 [Cyclotella cryptica]|uniref:Uncharacterized protein n=1 Tax=Cyclotella cryptica TaxID=29204 RepID=A0ABD3QAL8_9STRA|eukprot:CCRYP_007374-RA/>CCRYP_007374-RA protein AED:0.28 eAED:0.28 QI:0/-1/0/1/-1/1/1/0/779
MQRKIGAWKRRRKQEKGRNSVKSQDSGPSDADNPRQHGSITSTVPMHFHFTNASCSFVMDEKQQTGCDLTLASSSTLSGTKSRRTETNAESSVSRRSVDAPGWVSGNDSHISSEKRFVRRRAHLLSPSRVLIRHGPAPEWPPSKSSSFDSKNPAFTNECDSNQSPFCVPLYGGKENSVGKSPTLCRNRNMKTHHDPQVDTRQLALPPNQLRFLIDENDLSCSSRSTSSPPPDFKLPRKEIVDAIKCHDRLGRALSKLALNTEINDLSKYRVGANSHTSTTLTGTSTFGSFSAESFRDNRERDRLGATVRQRGQQRDVLHTNRELTIGSSFCRGANSKVSSNNEYIVGVVKNSSFSSAGLQANSWSFSDEIQWTGSESSQSNTSSKSNDSSFLQHVAFLEGLEDHIMKFNSVLIMDHITTPDTGDTSRDQPAESFFPSSEDLRSPPASSAPTKYLRHSVSSEIFHPSHPYLTPKADLQDVNTLSPPSTPASVFRFSKIIPPHIDGKSILQGITRIKEETASMLEGMESKLKLDLKELIENEVVQIKSVISERTDETEPTTTSPSIRNRHANSSFSRMQSQSLQPQYSTITHVMTPPPQPTTAAPSIDRNVMSEVIQKSLRSMESSILNKITLHMDRDALQHRAFIEELIDEKVTKVMAGQNLEFQMAMEEVKRAVKEAAVRPSYEPRPPDGSNAVITPSRYQAPNQAAHANNVTSNTDNEPTSPVLETETNIKVLEDSFADTMKMIDDFVADCDDIVSDFDKIAFRMEDSSSVNHDYFME